MSTARRKYRILLPIFAIAGGVALFLYFESHRVTLQSNTERDLDSSSAENRVAEAIAADESLATAQSPSSECVPLEQFIQSPDAYKLDEWFLSWGAPPIANAALLSRPYAHYDLEVLRSLAAGGDSGAMHELGLDLVWSALSEMSDFPDNMTLWNLGDEESPFASVVDGEKLQRGRDYLFQSAINGQTYALVEIGLSYSYERIIRTRNGRISETEDQHLQTRAYGFGESAEILIQGLHSTFYQSSISPEAESLGKSLAIQISSQIQAERQRLASSGSTTKEAVDHIPEELNICIETASPS